MNESSLIVLGRLSDSSGFPTLPITTHTKIFHVFFSNYTKDKIEQVGHENDDVVPDENCITNDKRKIVSKYSNRK